MSGLPCPSSYWTISKSDNIKQHDRVCQINLGVTNLAEFFTALGAPYPVLTDLELLSFAFGPSGPILPDPVKFLGGSSNLQSLSITDIPVPGIPELLLSCLAPSSSIFTGSPSIY